MTELFERIKKYKLASSEGINKVGNRVIRFEILYKLCIESESCIIEFLKKISDDFSKKLKEREVKFDKLEKEDLEDSDF